MADGDESERIDGESRVNELKLESVERVSNGQEIVNCHQHSFNSKALFILTTYTRGRRSTVSINEYG